MKRSVLKWLRGAAWAACVCGAALLALPCHADPAKPQITAFTLHVTNGALPPQYAHQEELRGQVTPHSVFATYTYTHSAPNVGKPGFHEAVFTWRGALPAGLRRQYLALAEAVAFQKPRPGPPVVGGGEHTLGLTYAGGHQASGVPMNVAGWEAFLAAVAHLAHSPKK